MSAIHEAERALCDDPGPFISADLTWRCWPAPAGPGEWLAHLLTDPGRPHFASVEVIAPPGVPLFERPYSDHLREWRRASWASLERFLTLERPASEAEPVSLDEVVEDVPWSFVIWIGEALETHADALEELACSQRLHGGERFLDYAERNVRHARFQRYRAAQLVGKPAREDLRESLDLAAPIGQLVANSAADSHASGEPLAGAYESVAAHIDLLAWWAGSRAAVEERLIYATVELARRKHRLENSKSYRWSAWARTLEAGLRSAKRNPSP